ncbi:DUF3572 domain-containing protein [Phreatobacter stygius]|uniref:DUF3572 family protein n=1 Tax=Phreatobacter stygius TaxID=1940610 RepID=A0A4D7B377_9HYPH|nr:DUF3572 domain-containing protein [Phreatobacter stygius]QCI68199.1 DUF3572 family protein [Phreatobacter stygius]
MTQRRDEGAREAAEALAVRALGFLAAEPERLDRFLALAGIDIAAIRDAAGQPGFLAAIMDYLMTDEPLLLAFAANEDLKPEAVVRAAHVLGVVPWERGYA